jgi:hypothetical protein
MYGARPAKLRRHVFRAARENAGGVAKIRPIATHNRHIHDYASWRGLLVLTGLEDGVRGTSPHLIRSADGHAAVWVGAVDDLWSLGKAVGVGGPWRDFAVKADEASDPYLMTGYDRKTLTLSHHASEPVMIRVEVDLSGTGHWVEYRNFTVPAGGKVTHNFPAGFQAYWLRVTADHATTATAQLVYQ